MIVRGRAQLGVHGAVGTIKIFSAWDSVQYMCVMSCEKMLGVSGNRKVQYIYSIRNAGLKTESSKQSTGRL